MTPRTATSARPLAITLGDPAGIGPETIVQAFRDAPSVTQNCVVVGDAAVLRRAAQVVAPGKTPLPLVVLESLDEVASLPPRCIPLWQVEAPAEPAPWGQVQAEAGRLAGRCVAWAARAALRGDVCGLVTAPLHKEALAAAGPPYNAFPGHTEMLQSLAAEHLACTVADLPVRMMLANDELRTVLVSIHMALRDALDAVTEARVFDTLRITHGALQALLERAPRIAVAGLNPHAGEGGLFGREEIETIAPAIARARAMGMVVEGPFAPDTVFMRARGQSGRPQGIDVVVAMYHDQGLIPVKYLGVEHGVNVTLGLPLVRTSPDHGTAFDIAGTGRADASSLVQAIRMARQLAGMPPAPGA